MKEVEKLLRQAWEEAERAGVSLNSVHFRCDYMSSYGEIKVILSGINIEAKLFEGE